MTMVTTVETGRPTRVVQMQARLDATILLPTQRGEEQDVDLARGLRLKSADALGLLSLQGNPELQYSSLLGNELPSRLVDETRIGWKHGVKVGFYEKKVPVKTGRQVRQDAPYQTGGVRVGARPGLLSGRGQTFADLEAVGATAYIAQLRPRSVTWTRNNLSEPDELSITLPADAFGGLDLRLIKAVQVDHWLFTQAMPGGFEARRRGEAGYFGGVATMVRLSRFGNELQLDCLDYTHLLASQELNGAQGRAIDLNQTLVSSVEALVRSVPGGDRWRVVDASTQLTPDRIKAKRLEGELGAAEGSLASLAAGSESSTQQAAVDKLQADLASVEAGFKSGIGQVVPGRYMSHAFWGFSKQGGRMSVWDAVLKLCSLVGAVPEFAVSQAGDPTVYLVDSKVLQAGNEGVQFRQFARRDPDGTERFHRRFTVGVDVWELESERRLETERRLDRVDVLSYDPDTGLVLKGSYGTGSRKKAGTETVEAITAHGITDQRQLDDLAERAYRSRVGQEFGLQLTTMAPWSTGGGTEDGPPDSPDRSAFRDINGTPETSDDLLYCAPGVPVEIVFPGFEQRNMGRKSLQQDAEAELVERLGGPQTPWAKDAAKAIADAMDRVRLSTLFQCAKIVHTFDAEQASYDAVLDLQAFLEESDEPRILRDATAYHLGVGE